MKLCIAEKPSVAREIAKILGANIKKNGYFEGNGYYISWTFGHLCELKEPSEYNPQWKKWALNYLPMVPEKFGIKVKDNPGVAQQFKTIEGLVQKSDEVINCGDAGQEGELIQRWVLKLANCNVPVKRLWISSLTQEALTEGFNNLYDASKFDSLYAAGSMRAIGDWLLGLNATRLYSIKYGNSKNVLSIGRVQTPTLALIVNRQKEIDKFKTETYWELKTIYKETLFSATKGKFLDKEKGEAKLAELLDKELEITEFDIKKGKEHPPKLFDLTALQVEANKKYSLTATETLNIIQSLYEKKLTSYPRVDTTYLPNDVYPKIKPILEKLKPYENFTAEILKAKIRKSKKVFDDKKVTDHHAIIPTGLDPNNLSLNEKQVYDLVTRRFISVFYPDCIVSNTTVKAMVEKTEFKAVGKQILEDGWRILYKKDTSNTKEEAIMPTFIKGEKGPHKPELQEKNTTPPKHYTEATLLRAMETAGKKVKSEELRELMKENGIGRPSTRANIIETLFRRNYVIKDKKKLIATITGIQLIDTIENDLLKSAELTGLWEKKLRQIERGEFSAAVFMEEMKAMVTEVVNQVKQAKIKKITILEDKVEKPKKGETKKIVKKEYNNSSALDCPKCKKGKILKGKKAYGCSNWKNGCGLVIPFEIYGKKLTQTQTETLIKKGKTANMKGFKMHDKKFDAKLILDENFKIKFVKT